MLKSKQRSFLNRLLLCVGGRAAAELVQRAGRGAPPPNRNAGGGARLRRSWGVHAVRAAAHLRVSRAGFVGMPTHVVQSLRRVDARAQVDPAIYMAGNAPTLDRRV